MKSKREPQPSMADAEPEVQEAQIEEERALAKVETQVLSGSERRRAYHASLDEALSKSTEGREGINLEKVRTLLMNRDYGSMSVDERTAWLTAMHTTLGLNPMFPVIRFLLLDGKLTPYFERGATDQLRDIHKVDIKILSQGRDETGTVYITRAWAALPNGRTDEDMGATGIVNQQGTELGNSMKRSVTQAKRRVTLSILGLGGFVDESEVQDIKNARVYESPAPRQIAPPQQAVAYHPQSAVRSADVPPGGLGTSPLEADATSRPAAPVMAPAPPPVPTPGWGASSLPIGGGGPLPPPRPATPSPIQGITFAPQGGTPTPAVAVVSAPPARPSGRPQPKRG